MRNRIVYILLFLFLASCGDEKDINRENAQENQNLFSIAANSETHKDLDDDLFGLWKSGIFRNFDISYQILWEVTPSSTTIALKCQFHDRDPLYVQVEAEFEEDLVQAFDSFSIYNFPIAEDFKTEERKRLLSTAEMVGAERYPIERNFRGTQTPSEGNLIQPESMQASENTAYLVPIGAPHQETRYYGNDENGEEDLCRVAIDGSQIEAKGLLASGMESWTMDESEEHNDSVIRLGIEEIETPILLRKIQNR